MSLIQGQKRYLPLVSRFWANAKLPPELGCALVHHESGWKVDAIRLDGPDGARGGAHGLFQITLATARALEFKGTVEGLLYADTNTMLAVKLALQNVKVMASNKPSDIAAAHNCGAGHVKKGTIPVSTFSIYVPAVLQLCEIYRPLCSQYVSKT